MPRRDDIHKILIIGSGPMIVGQASEFDYSGTQACKALRSMGYQVVVVNSNPVSIMTDAGMADATYIEPMNLKTLSEIIAKEKPDALLPAVGGRPLPELPHGLYAYVMAASRRQSVTAGGHQMRWEPSPGSGGVR